MISLIYASEDSDKFNWIFTKFLELYVVPPAVILTDSCQKMALAIEQVFPKATHLLCVYHISINFFDHIHGIVGNEWFNINRQFWKLAKETDLRSIDNFDDEFKSLEEAIRAATVTSGHAANSAQKVELATKWLRDRLFDRRKQWAYRWTWSYFTVGCHATQRSESIHSALKKILRSSNFSLVQMFTIISDYQTAKDFFGDLQRFRYEERVHRVVPGIHMAVLKLELNEYALAKLQEQYNQALFYSMSERRGPDSALRGWDVQRTVVVPLGGSASGDGGAPVSASSSLREGGAAGRDSTSVSSSEEFQLLGDTLVDASLQTENEQASRFVSVTGDCSCQNKTTVGITCRHVMCCSIITQHKDSLGNARFIGGAAGSRYSFGAKTAERDLDATRGIRGDTLAPVELTKAERERQLHALATQVVSVGKNDVALMNYVTEQLTELLRQVKLRRPALVPVSLPAAAASSSARATPLLANPLKQTDQRVGKQPRKKGAHSLATAAATKARTKEKRAEKKAAKKITTSV
jgi:hypothetical protein